MSLTVIVATRFDLASAWLGKEHTLMPDQCLNMHPALINFEVLALKRRESMCMYTVNPLVINEMQAKDVWLVTESGRGCRLDLTANFIQRSRIYAYGELWLSHCDGLEEVELIPPDVNMTAKQFAPMYDPKELPLDRNHMVCAHEALQYLLRMRRNHLTNLFQAGMGRNVKWHLMEARRKRLEVNTNDHS